MSSDRYHKAAKDGLLDVLKEITRAEANCKDQDGMTPVLWAAFEGQLEALRFLVGRGGDPDKSDRFGNTALHLAAAKGHLNCVDFLTKFGVNLYALDIDRHSAKDLAAINNRNDILRYLDVVAANLELRDKKKAKALKEIAEKNCEKRIKEYAKRRQNNDQDISVDYLSMQTVNHRPSTMLAALKHKIWSCSQGNLKQPLKEQQSILSSCSNSTKFSDLVSGGTVSSRSSGIVQKKAFASKFRQQNQQQPISRICSISNPFKFSEIESNGKRTITSLQGLQGNSEVLYAGSFSSNSDNGKRGKITDIFDLEATDDDIDNCNQDDTVDDIGIGNNGKIGYGGTLSRSYSQPDILAVKNNEDDTGNEIKLHRPFGLFDRPTLGSLAFRRSVTAALNQLNSDALPIDTNNSFLTTSSTTTTTTTSAAKKNLSSSKSRDIKLRSFLALSDSESDGVSESDDDGSDNGTPIQRFLAVWGLEEYLHIFLKQQIDLDTLMLLTESDLKSLNLPLGPFRKLIIAIQERKTALANPGAISDSRL